MAWRRSSSDSRAICSSCTYCSRTSLRRNTSAISIGSRRRMPRRGYGTPCGRRSMPSEVVDIAVRAAERAKELPDPDADAPVYPTSLDLVALSKMPVPVALHRIGQILPLGTPGLLTGHGGIGKTQLAIHLLLCFPKGLQFFGEPTLASRVGFASGEDDARECHRRLALQASILGVDLADYADELFVYDLSGEAAILLHQTRDDHVVQTHHYAWLKAEVERRGIEVLIIDNLLTVFAGNINDPAIATRVIGMLGRLVQPGGNVIILAHVDKNTARDGRSSQGYSGTAAWHNRVRWRWFMYAPN